MPDGRPPRRKKALKVFNVTWTDSLNPPSSGSQRQHSLTRGFMEANALTAKQLQFCHDELEQRKDLLLAVSGVCIALCLVDARFGSCQTSCG
jgi:hypothetical protein